MGRIIALFVLLAFIAMLILFLRSPRAEQVEHHGQMVNASGTAVDCLTCHDGLAATAVSNCIGVNCLLRNDLDSHPVSIPYPQDGPFKKYDDVVRNGVKLDQSQISCISCHDLKNQTPGHLIEGGNLCLRCHIK